MTDHSEKRSRQMGFWTTKLTCQQWHSDKKRVQNNDMIHFVVTLYFT